MLVITRREGDRIILDTSEGEQIVIEVMPATRGQYRVAIEAPQSITISRAECPKDTKRQPFVVAGLPVVSEGGRLLTWKSKHTEMRVRLQTDSDFTVDTVTKP